MRHYLIYSQADQQTLRDPGAAEGYYGVAVPGTVAAYFPDATASFILTTHRPYFIDPRTPLFQGELTGPRVSHFSLAECLSPTLAERLRASGEFGPEFYQPDVIEELVTGTVRFQREYAARGATLGAKLDKYARLLAEARNEPPPADPHDGLLTPELTLLPYFCATSDAADEWLSINQAIWNCGRNAERPTEISPVVALNSENPGDLANLLALLPDGLRRRVPFWLTGFDEREEPAERLVELWRVIAAYSAQYELENLYGSYFSIIASHAGLSGITNGIGYSESRRWPELAASGAAPARYYVAALHAFLSPGDAQLLIDLEPWFACPCEVCAESRVTGLPAIVALSYHELKRHFVLSRKAEMEFVARSDLRTVIEQLREAQARGEAARSAREPVPVRVPTGHLGSWAEALEQVGEVNRGGQP